MIESSYFRQHRFKMALEIISSADSLIICAGAGMSVDSGLPDYRGDKGFWNRYAGAGNAVIPYERLSSSVAFEQIPEIAWGFAAHQMLMYRNAIPHVGYQILKDLSTRMEHGSFVVTSNIDELFVKAGFDRSRIYEVHGSIHRLQCADNCTEAIWDADDLDPEIDLDDCRLLSELPRCPDCGGLARPNVVLMSDWSYNDTMTQFQKNRFQTWREKCQRPVVIEIGAGTGIATIRRFSERLKLPLIRINLEEPELPLGITGVSIPSSALEALTQLESVM